MVTSHLGEEQRINVLQLLKLHLIEMKDNAHHVVVLAGKFLHLATVYFLSSLDTLQQQVFLVVVNLIECALRYLQMVGNIIHPHGFHPFLLEEAYGSHGYSLVQVLAITGSNIGFLHKEIITSQRYKKLFIPPTFSVCFL